jgi:hypothetical protein
MKMPCMVQIFICIGLDFWGKKIIIISKQRRLQITSGCCEWKPIIKNN